jgi:MFS family permease
VGPHPEQSAAIADDHNRNLRAEAGERRARRRRRESLWSHRDFVRLWSAESVSRFGSQVSLLALPFIAITVLHTSAFQVGLLSTMEFLPFVLVGLPAGVWVDRLRRRPVLIAGDLGRALALGSVPVAHFLGVLSMAQLYVVAFVAGVLTVFFDVAYQSYLPRLVRQEQLVEGNAKLEISSSGAAVAGPGLAGLLIQAFTAPVAVLVDALSFLASAGFIARIRRPEPPPPPARGSGMRREIAEGLRYVLGHRLLRWVAAATGTFNLFSSMTQAILVLYLVRQLGMSAGLIGLVMTIGNAGWLIGASASGRLSGRIGVGMAVMSGTVVGAAGALLIPLAPAGSPVPWLIAATCLMSLGTTVYNIGQLSVRQAITPQRLHGRMNATMRFMVWGTMPLGAAIGGALGQTIGLRPTLWIGALGALIPIGEILASRIWTLRTVEEAVARFLPAPAPVQPEAPEPASLSAGTPRN